mmetsp:Transcript_137605/g.243150  ORF Transcript_137605/g.243150 Transcript_137605/m.243150 type:complete len:224 (-) Transcript_137605:111-782(-)
MAVHDDKKSAHPAQSAVSEAAAKQGFSERPAPPPPGSEEIARREKAAEAAMKAATARLQGSEELSSYLGFFGYEATSAMQWSEAHLDGVRESSQLVLEVALIGSDRVDGHTWYVLDCALWKPLVDFGRAEWQIHRRLTHMREGLHDVVKEMLGSDQYSKHFGSTPFAQRGGFWGGTEERLRSWCQNLARFINSGEAPPAVTAAALRFFAAPPKNPAVVALVRG